MSGSQPVVSVAPDAVFAPAWRELDTAAVSDALDRSRIAGQVQGIEPLDRRWRIVGRACTVQMMPVGPAGGTVGDYVDAAEAGAVIVIDNRGRSDCTVWGDLLTTVAARRRIAGTVIDGVCRDIAGALAAGYPLFSRGVNMRTGKDRVTAAAVNVPVTLGDIPVHPGDLVVGDADGIVIVPRALEERVLAAAREITAREGAIRLDIESGMTLAEARARHGYHTLQRDARG